MRKISCRNARIVVISAFFVVLLALQMEFLAGCSNQESIAAVYLAPESGGQLRDLAEHPDILAVHTFEDLKKAVENALRNSSDDAAGKLERSGDIGRSPAVSIWIDKDAAHQFDSSWFQEEPQTYPPLVLVGYNDALYSFREKLSLPGIEGPFVDWDFETLEPGFSIWILLERTESSEKSWMKGYDTEPTIEGVLSAEQALMQGESLLQLSEH